MKNIPYASWLMKRCQPAPRGPRKVPLYSTTRCEKCGGSGRSIRPTELRRWRVQSGLTMKQVGRWAGVDTSYVKDIELGNRACTEYMLGFYQQMAHVDLSRIINIVLDMPRKRR